MHSLPSRHLRHSCGPPRVPRDFGPDYFSELKLGLLLLAFPNLLHLNIANNIFILPRTPTTPIAPPSHLITTQKAPKASLSPGHTPWPTRSPLAHGPPPSQSKSKLPHLQFKDSTRPQPPRAERTLQGHSYGSLRATMESVEIPQIIDIPLLAGTLHDFNSFFVI